MPTTEAQYQEFCNYIDQNQESLKKHLGEWVSIRSVSTNDSCRPLVFKMLEVAKEEFVQLGADMRLVDNPLPPTFGRNGEELPYPPMLLGTYPPVPDPNKKTFLRVGILKFFFFYFLYENFVGLKFFEIPLFSILRPSRCPTCSKKRRLGLGSLDFRRKRRKTLWPGFHR